MRGWRRKRIASGSMSSCTSGRTPEGMTGRAKGVGKYRGMGAKADYAFLHTHTQEGQIFLFSFPLKKIVIIK